MHKAYLKSIKLVIFTLSIISFMSYTPSPARYQGITNEKVNKIHRLNQLAIKRDQTLAQMALICKVAVKK